MPSDERDWNFAVLEVRFKTANQETFNNIADQIEEWLETCPVKRYDYEWAFPA